MKDIFFEDETEPISVNDVNFDRPVFVKKDDILGGMLVLEDRGWIARIGPDLGVSGYHETAKECMLDARKYGYDFIVNELDIRYGA